jgi:hypothetical protein
MVKIDFDKFVMDIANRKINFAKLIRLRNKLVAGKAVHFCGHVIKLEDNEKYSSIPCDGCEFYSPESVVCDLCLECGYRCIAKDYSLANMRKCISTTLNVNVWRNK